MLWPLDLCHIVTVPRFLDVVAFSFVSTCNRFWTLWILALCQTVTVARFVDVVAFSFVSHCDSGQVSGHCGF